MNDSGLPDYVDDLFRYLVRSSIPTRIAQVVFFISGLILPVLMLMIFPDENGEAALNTYMPLFIIGGIFAACLFWYLGWLEMRRHRFRTEKPSSYARWFGWRGRERRLTRDPLAQLSLLKLQLRYVLFGKEPSPSETLALTMKFVRRSA